MALCQFSLNYRGVSILAQFSLVRVHCQPTANYIRLFLGSFGPRGTRPEFIVVLVVLGALVHRLSVTWVAI
jgi:hypothetical protein